MSGSNGARRETPHSEEAERAALGSVLIREDALTELAADLRGVDDFMFPAHREIFEAMLELSKRKRSIDPLTLADQLKANGVLGKLKGGAVYLNEIANETPTAANVAHYARIVREKAALRRLIAACDEVRSQAYGDHGEFDAFMADAVRKVGEAAAGGKERSRESVGDLGDRVLREAEDSATGRRLVKVPTGITGLDKILRGGLAREHLVVPIGQTSSGKSSFGFQIAFRGAHERRIPALIFSLEMTRAECFVKGAALISRIDTNDFYPQPGERMDRKHWDRITAATKVVQALGDSGLVTIEEERHINGLVAIATAWRAKHPDELAFILVDQFSKIRGVREKGGTREQEVSSTSSTLKELAKDLKLPLCAISQVNDDAKKEKRAPQLGDTRESRAIEHDADVVISVHRPDRVAVRSKPELCVLKQRGGRVGKKTVQWCGEWQGFEDLPTDEEED